MKSVYSHLATSLKENLLMRLTRQSTLCDKVEVLGYQHVLDVASEDKGVIILTGHFGNWEFAPVAGISKFKQFRGHFYFIRKTLGFKWLERILFGRYYRAGLRVIPKKHSLNKIFDALEANHAVVFVMDQHACIKAKDGMAVEFFGKKAGTYRSLATIAQYTGVPVVPASSYRLPNGKHILEFHPAIEWQAHEDRMQAVYQNTLAYNQALERLIEDHPEQWLWLHRRWKI